MKIRLIKIIVMIIFIYALLSCGNEKEACDAYSTIQFIKQDTLCIESQHIHIDGESLCGYFDDIEIITIDTIEVQVFN